MKRVFRVLLVLVAVLSFSACNNWGVNKMYDPSQVDFKVMYPQSLEGQFYPSLALGVANYVGDGVADSNMLFSVSVTAPVNNAVLRVVVDSSVLNYVTILQEVLPRRGQRYTFYPKVKWKYDNLYRMRQQGMCDITFTCFVNDEEVDTKDIHLNYRSVNECLLRLKQPGGMEDYRWLFAAYVNEEHPYIDSILSDILEQGLVPRLSGYQSGAKYVVSQVEAVWYYALNRGISYSSISCTPNPSKYSNVQHIRFFDEVYNTRQANCIDACVFFASILRKIGLKPVIFVEPCHAYLGYYTDRKRKDLKLLETTITGWVDFPAMQRSIDNQGKVSPQQYAKVSKYLTDQQKSQYEASNADFEQLKRWVAQALFEKASTYDADNYASNKEHFLDTENLSYQMLDIELLRRQVQPITGAAAF